MTHLDMNDTQNENAIRVLEGEELDQVSGGFICLGWCVVGITVAAAATYYYYKKNWG